SIHCSLSLLVLKIQLLRKQKRLKNSCMNWIVLIGKWLKQNKIKTSCGKLVMKFLLLSAIKKVKIFWVDIFVHIYHHLRMVLFFLKIYSETLHLEEIFCDVCDIIFHIHILFTVQ